MTEKLDVIIFGATGFTGKHTVVKLAKLSKLKNRNLRWGIAGRSQEKLKEVLDYAETQFGSSLQNIPNIIADVRDEKSLHEMAKRARIIINCCGPFRYFGEAVVKACIEEGTHHVDVSAEIQYMEEMQLKYHEKAKEKGVYVVGACAFASIPVDSGIAYLEQKFSGTLNSVVVYVKYETEENNIPGSSYNYGTWESMINVVAYSEELSKIRKQLYPGRLPTFKPHLKKKLIHKTDLVEGWAAPFRATDNSTVSRSQRYFYDNASKRPIQLQTYGVIPSLYYLILVGFFGGLVLLLSKFKMGTKLLLKYPKVFSKGYVSHENPSEEILEKGHVTFTFYGEGWKEKLSNANADCTTPPNRAITATIKGGNPGYGVTCTCAVLAAIVCITETEKMPPPGGVYPPGYAFANTSLMEKLNEQDVKIEILGEKDL